MFKSLSFNILYLNYPFMTLERCFNKTWDTAVLMHRVTNLDKMDFLKQFIHKMCQALHFTVKVDSPGWEMSTVYCSYFYLWFSRQPSIRIRSCTHNIGGSLTEIPYLSSSSQPTIMWAQLRAVPMAPIIFWLSGVGLQWSVASNLDCEPNLPFCEV